MRKTPTLFLTCASATIVLLPYAICYLLVEHGRASARLSMGMICQRLKGRKVSTAFLEDLVSPSARDGLHEIFVKLGVIQSAHYEIDTCQMSGTPCIVRLSLRSSKSQAQAKLYFNGTYCSEVEPFPFILRR